MNVTTPGFDNIADAVRRSFDPLGWTFGVQWICLIVSALAVWAAWGVIRKRIIAGTAATSGNDFVRGGGRFVASSCGPILYFLAFLVLSETFKTLDMERTLVVGARNLVGIWALVRLVLGLLPNRALARFVAVAILLMFALNMFGVLSPITEFLEGVSLELGSTKLTVLGLIKGGLVAIVLLQLAVAGVQAFERYIKSSKGLTPSAQVLSLKAVKAILYTGAALITLSSLGMNLTHMAIFSGALGVGIGFGLKTIFANLVSGVVLLVDRSIKPGDVITVGDVFGQVQAMFGRYVSVWTRDGVEYLIPNEELFSAQVVNWTYSDSNVRLKIPVGVAYEADIPLAMALLERAADEVPRVLIHPAPGARLIGFGDSSVQLELRIWIADAENGVTNVKSAVQLKIWELFHENGIVFPFPQRDVLIKPDSALRVVMDREPKE